MLSNFLQTAITLIDTLMIGQLGPISIAAVGMGNTLRLFLLITILSVAGGAISLMAQAKGSRDKQRMNLVTRQALVSGLLMSILLGIFGYFAANPLLLLLDQGGEIEAVTLGTVYLQTLFLGTPFLVLNIITNKLMQGAGDTVTPLLLTISMLVLNVLFNYLFIFGWAFIPAYGVVGAALGTLLARGILVVVSLVLFYSGRNVIQILAGTWWPDWSMIKDILAIGIPSGIQGIFRHGSNLIIIGLITATSLGTYGAAVLAIGMQMEQLIAQPIVGLNVAATSLIGQDLGKWQTEAAYKKGILMTMLGVIAMVLFVFPAYWFAPQILLLFDPSAHPSITAGGLSYFNITLWALPFSAIGIVLTGTLRGAGDTKPAMYSAIINRNFVQLSVSWWLAFPMGLGFVGVWWGIVVGRVLDSLVMSSFWVRKKWLMVALQKTPIYRQYLQHLSKEDLQQYLTAIRSPLMAQTGMTEVLKDKQVVYKKLEERTVIEFMEDRYFIMKN